MARSDLKLLATVLMVYLIAALAVQTASAAEAAPAKEGAAAPKEGAAAAKEGAAATPAGAAPGDAEVDGSMEAPAPGPSGGAASIVPASFAFFSALVLGFVV